MFLCRKEPNLIPDCTMFPHWWPVYGNCIIGSMSVCVCIFVCGIHVFTTTQGQKGTENKWKRSCRKARARLFLFVCVHNQSCALARTCVSMHVCMNVCASPSLLCFLNSFDLPVSACVNNSCPRNCLNDKYL